MYFTQDSSNRVMKRLWCRNAKEIISSTVGYHVWPITTMHLLQGPKVSLLLLQLLKALFAKRNLDKKLAIVLSEEKFLLMFLCYKISDVSQNYSIFHLLNIRLIVSEQLDPGVQIIVFYHTFKRKYADSKVIMSLSAITCINSYHLSILQ